MSGATLARRASDGAEGKLPIDRNIIGGRCAEHSDYSGKMDYGGASSNLPGFTGRVFGRALQRI
jgi:hypothetical protein